MTNDFDEVDNKDENITNKEKLNNVLSFIPFLNLWMLSVEKKDETELTKKFNRQWIALFLLYIVLFILCSFIWFWKIVTIAYLLAIIFFWAKAYNWEYVEIDFLEKIIEKFNKNIKK